jgi:hypothetical protein
VRRYSNPESILMIRSVRFIPALAVLMAASACASLNKKEQGAIIGAGTRAVVGGVVGNATG